MSKFTADDVNNCMRDLSKVRNVVMVGPIGIGKTCAMDCLGAQCGMVAENKIGETRFAHARQDEKERGCTMKMNVTSLVINDLLLHCMDAPGHAEYSAEMTAAMPLADGALVIVDGAGSGMSGQGGRQVKEAVDWGVEPVLFVNRLDVPLLVTKKSPDDIANDLTEVVEAFNGVLSAATSPIGAELSAKPVGGNVIFGSLKEGWAFTIPQMAAMYAAKFDIAVEKMSERLWGSYYAPKTRKWSSSQQPGSVRGLVQFVIQPISQVWAACEAGDVAKVEKMMTSLGAALSAADTKLEGKALFRRAMQLWMPAGTVIAKTLKEFVPDPATAQAKRYPQLVQGPTTDPTALAVKACSSEGTLIFQSVKMTPQPANPTRFYCIGRVFSGNFGADKCFLLEDDYLPPHAEGQDEADEFQEEEGAEAEAAAAPAAEEAGEEEAKGGDTPPGTPAGGAKTPPGRKPPKAGQALEERRAQGVLICAPKAFTATTRVPAGNVCAVGGIDQFVTKRITAAATANSFPMRAPTPSISAVVRTSVQPKDVKDLPKMVEALRRLSKTCPLVEISSEDSGNHVVSGAGEEHMRILKRDLEGDYLAGIPLVWGAPRVSYRETATAPSNQTCLAKSPNKHNRLYVVAEPLGEAVNQAIEGQKLFPTQDMKKRAKILEKEFEWDKTDSVKVWGFGPAPEEAGSAWGANMIVDQTKAIQYLGEIKESVNSALLWAAKQGPICEERMRGVRFNLTDCKLHADSIHRGMGQIQPPARRVFFSSMMTGECRLVEPIFLASIEAPASAQPGIMQALGTCRGEMVQSEEADDGTVKLDAYVPIAETIGATPFATVLMQKTNGRAFVSYAFDHWENVPSDPLACDPKTFKPTSKAAEIMMTIRKQKGLKEQPPILTDYLDRL